MKYQGGLSNEIMKQKYVKDYIKSGLVCGYLGHSVRTKRLDAYLEQKFLSLVPPKHNDADVYFLLAVWLTSTNGRHFGDSLEGQTLKEQKRIIDEDIKSIFNIAYIYALPEHEGSYASTIALKEKYKDVLFTATRIERKTYVL